MNEYVVVGKIINTRGLKGEIKVLNYTDFPADRYKKGKIIEIYNENEDIYYTEKITSFNIENKFVHLKLFGLDRIEDVEKFKNSIIIKRKEELPKLNEGEFYFHELKGLNAYFNENKIGVIENVEDNYSQVILRVKNDLRYILIPFVEDFIKEIDIENNKIIFENIEALL